MSNTIDAFKRLLCTIPKADLTESSESIYQRYYDLNKTYNIELFLFPQFQRALSEASASQHEYNTLFTKYKEFAKLSQEYFDLSS